MWSALGSIFLVCRKPCKGDFCAVLYRSGLQSIGFLACLLLCCLGRHKSASNNKLSTYLIHSNFHSTLSWVFKWLFRFPHHLYNFFLSSFRFCKVKMRLETLVLKDHLCTLTQGNKTPPHNTLALSKVLTAMQSHWAESALEFVLPRQNGHSKPFCLNGSPGSS